MLSTTSIPVMHKDALCMRIFQLYRQLCPKDVLSHVFFLKLCRCNVGMPQHTIHDSRLSLQAHRHPRILYQPLLGGNIATQHSLQPLSFTVFINTSRQQQYTCSRFVMPHLLAAEDIIHTLTIAVNKFTVFTCDQPVVV